MTKFRKTYLFSGEGLTDGEEGQSFGPIGLHQGQIIKAVTDLAIDMFRKGGHAFGGQRNVGQEGIVVMDKVGIILQIHKRWGFG